MKHQIGRSPSYLVRNPHSYCFRMRVPVDIQIPTIVLMLLFSIGLISLLRARKKFEK